MIQKNNKNQKKKKRKSARERKSNKCAFTALILSALLGFVFVFSGENMTLTLWVALPVAIVIVELWYLTYMFGTKPKEKFNWWINKVGAIVLAIVTCTFIGALGGLIAHTVKAVTYGLDDLIDFLATNPIWVGIGMIILLTLILWFRMNKAIAEKNLGKDRLK